jgi:RND superfamily putative drug exporter
MATKLYRLGRWTFGHRKTVVLAWTLVVVLVGFSAATFSGQTSDKFEVPGTESQRAQDLLEKKYPEASGTYARVVFAAPEGHRLTEAQYKKGVEESVAELKKADEVSQVVSPYESGAMSNDRRIGFADVIYPVPADEIDDHARDALAETAAPAEQAGLQVEFNGGLVKEETKNSAEAMGMMIGFLVLAITLASLLAAGMPLLTAVVGVGIGVAGITALSGVFDMTEATASLATMLGLAVGIDYALFILSRHRSNMADGMEPREAAAQATATAGSAVVFAGATVVIALVGLTVVGIPFLTTMGLAAAGTVAIAVLIALTLLPAVLGFAGHRVARRNRVLAFRPRGGSEGKENMSIRWALFVTARPLPILLVGLTLLLVIAIPATHMKLGLPDGGSQPTSTTERRAYDLLSEGFGAGFNGPLTVVVDAESLSREEQKQVAGALSEGLQGFQGVAAVSEPSQNKAGDLTVVSVTPSGGPASDETRDLVTVLRDKADEIREESGIEAYLTGTTALNIDTADQLSAALPKYIAVVVGLALLLLMVVFRSILVPLKAAAGFLLSIAAAMGLVVWVFQDGNLADLFSVSQAGPIVSFLPILLIGILFGLAMDYEVFLVSRMREAFVHTGNARESIITGFGQSGRVVVAAALIMIGVFGGFVLDPDPVLKSIGLALAFGVLVDAFVVRMTLVPAVMALLGRHAWRMPRRLQRLVPNVDIEGEGLAKGLTPSPTS